MSQSAGYLSKVKHATTLGGSYTSVAGVTSSTLDMKADELDISSLADDDGWRRFIMGLGDATMSYDMDVIEGNTQQEAIRDALTDKTSVFLQFLYDGTNGFKGEFFITGISYSDPVDGKSTCTVSARLTGAPTAV